MYIYIHKIILIVLNFLCLDPNLHIRQYSRALYVFLKNLIIKTNKKPCKRNIVILCTEETAKFQSLNKSAKTAETVLCAFVSFSPFK